MAKPRNANIQNRLRSVVVRVLRKILSLLHLMPMPTKRQKAEHYKELRRQKRLLLMFERARKISGQVPAVVDADDRLKTPWVANIKAVEAEVLMYGAEDSFFRALINEVPVGDALIQSVRKMCVSKGLARARSVAQAMQNSPDLQAAGDVALANVAFYERMLPLAWDLFNRHDLDWVLRLCADEYFRTGFRVDVDKSCEGLETLLAGDYDAHVTAMEWLRIAKWSFGGGREDLSLKALEHARAAVVPGVNTDVEIGIKWLEQWYGRAAAAKEPVVAPAGTIPLAVMDYKQPDEFSASANLGDHVQTIASLGHVVRHTGFNFTGNSELVEVAEKLKARVKSERLIEGDDATFALYRFDRDASNYFPMPEGTWAITFGWYMHAIFRMKYDLPFNPRLNPVFISVHINKPELLTPDTIDYLKAHGPIGCRDWNTTFLLISAGVPAFFSGCLTTTIDTVFPAKPASATKGKLFVDTVKDDDGESFAQVFPGVRYREFSENIDHALEVVGSYPTYKNVYTSRLHSYLPGRSIGANMEFRPKNPSDPRFDGLAFISDSDYDAIRNGILEKLNVVMTAIGAGKSKDEVYEIWRDICAADVEKARQMSQDFEEIAEPTFSVAEACKSIRSRSVTIERTAPAPEGEEINVEFSLDGNLKHHLQVVLGSVVEKASRPIRAFVLCRDHDQSDFDRVSALFPTVSFVWLPTDDVDYGDVIGMIKHITVATMDRLLLPELLPDVDRIIHHDLDAICVSDLAELFDTDLHGHPIAARTSPQPEFKSGFRTIILASERLKKSPERARELILRTHARHVYDFDGFNAGIMVLDLKRMRVDDFCRHFLPYAERFGMHDQEILNAYAGADRTELDTTWNMLPRIELLDNPKIVHWAGFQKPWNDEYVQGQQFWVDAERKLVERQRAFARG